MSSLSVLSLILMTLSQVGAATAPALRWGRGELRQSRTVPRSPGLPSRQLSPPFCSPLQRLPHRPSPEDKRAPPQLAEHAQKTERNFPGSQCSGGSGLIGQHGSLPSKRVNKDLAPCFLSALASPSQKALGSPPPPSLKVTKMELIN